MKQVANRLPLKLLSLIPAVLIGCALVALLAMGHLMGQLGGAGGLAELAWSSDGQLGGAVLAITLWPFGGRRATRNKPVLAWLIPVNPGAMGQYPIKHAVNRIGRAEDNDICINHDTVSSHHAELKLRRDGFFSIEDRNSTNGILVNGKEVKSRILRDNDLIEIGEVRLRLVLEKKRQGRDG